MKLYAFNAPDVPQHNGYLKIGETAGSVDVRIKQESHELNIKCVRVWDDAIYTEPSQRGIDKLLHRELGRQGFHRQIFEDTGQPTEWFKCEAGDVIKAYAEVKNFLDEANKHREELGEQFYREIRNWFYWATENTNCTGDYALRLAVRLLLCFFFMEKELVPKELFDENWLKDILKEDEENRFYNGILCNIFFHCLNTPLEERNDYEHKKVFRQFGKSKEQFQKIPFLNGGIFNEHTGDDFVLHNKYFFQEKETVYINALESKLPVAGIVRILSKYQYKLSFDDLLDKSEYAKTVDPEFVGKVFESLLACIDADTNLNRRKVTGSYYTPNEIVEYMVNESLDAYLRSFSVADNAKRSALLSCRILDPACGSGAFPCGVMSVLMQRLYGDVELTQNERYRKKLEILQNVIYGVDIQPTAVQIAVLRLFLSLIQDLVPDKKKSNSGIEPLPNLETKFVCANTLIPLQKQERQQRFELPMIKDVVKQLQFTRAQHLVASNPIEKKRLQEFDASLRHTLSVALEHNGDLSHDVGGKLAQWNPYDQTKSACFFDSYYMFGVEKFDIIIGNPPYGAKYPKEQEKYFKEHYESAKTITGKQKGSLDTFSLFIENGFNSVKTNGVVNFIVSIAFTSSDSMSALHNLLLQNCETIRISNYAKRPTQIFRDSCIANSIILFIKSETRCKQLLTTKMNRLQAEVGLKNLFAGLQFTSGLRYRLKGRIPKISLPVEKRILQKLFSKNNKKAGNLLDGNGKPVYYRTSGGRYYNIVTNRPTGSTKEKPLFFDKKYADVIGAVLSSSLFWWFQQVYSNSLDLKSYEIEMFPVPAAQLKTAVIRKIEKLYAAYLADIERNVIEHQTDAYKKIDSFKEYKLVKSKHLIDAIDDLICPLYGLTDEETAFIKNYEIEFRMRGE